MYGPYGFHLELSLAGMQAKKLCHSWKRQGQTKRPESPESPESPDFLSHSLTLDQLDEFDDHSESFRIIPICTFLGCPTKHRLAHGLASLEYRFSCPTKLSLV